MLDDEERRRLKELAVAVTKRPLSESESVEYGSLVALELGASREPYERPEPKPRRRAGSQEPKVKRKRRRGRR
jgi:hypothetical protein